MAVDVAVLTVVDGALSVVLWRRTGQAEPGTWALPGSFVRERERLDNAVARTLQDKCGIRGLAPRQLKVMDAADRDDRGWVLSVAHLEVVDPSSISLRLSADEVQIAPVRSEAHAGSEDRSILDLPDGQAALPFDHEEIVKLAINELRATYRERPDPAGLLGDRFTILQLRHLHEAVAGAPFQKDGFRRAMVPHLEQLDVVEEGTVGRPARLYRRRKR